MVVTDFQALTTALKGRTPYLPASGFRRSPTVRSRFGHTSDRSPFSRASMPMLVALPSEKVPRSGIIGGLVQVVKRALAVIVQLIRKLVGLFAVLQPSTMLAYDVRTTGEVAKMSVMKGFATRNFDPPDKAYQYFDYTFSPFYASLSDSELNRSTDIRLGGNTTVRWLHWVDSRALTEFELAADLGRLELLKRVVDEAVEVEKASRQRNLMSPFLRWFDNGAANPQNYLSLPSRNSK